MSYAVLIPARYASTRLPGKVLLAESGKFLVQHVYERAREAPGVSTVAVLTDDERVADAVRSFAGEVRMTRADHASGTDRCAEAAADLEEDVVINLQADEPLVVPGDLATLAAAVAEDDWDAATLAHPFQSGVGLKDPSAVKAIFRDDSEAITFTRDLSTLTEDRAPGGWLVMHHMGIYAFRRKRLLEFSGLAPTANEKRERLEQLRALDHGWRIRIVTASAPAFGVDTREDYDRFLRSL